jgi:hypothetical protein
MFKPSRPLLTAILQRSATQCALIALMLGVNSGIQAQSLKTGSPGFTRSIYIPSARNQNNRYENNYGNRNLDYYRHQNYRGDRNLTIINGGQNCFNCRVNDSNYRRSNNNGDRRDGTFIFERDD